MTKKGMKKIQINEGQPSTPKPRTPRTVFSKGMVLYTIVDYVYQEKSEIFKEGWFPVKQFNPEHPNMKKLIEKTLKAQQKVLDRKNINWEDLQRVITI